MSMIQQIGVELACRAVPHREPFLEDLLGTAIVDPVDPLGNGRRSRGPAPAGRRDEAAEQRPEHHGDHGHPRAAHSLPLPPRPPHHALLRSGNETRRCQRIRRQSGDGKRSECRLGQDADVTAAFSSDRLSSGPPLSAPP